ncbi:plasmid pRiA4b ORF-3 family protein [Geodermatophilus sp. DF01-2]|nr:plasmid pRiA4b ORF-3 family protein [Geodermatophilus sp. DF01_2]
MSDQDGQAVELTVTLRHTRPRVWRRLAVPPSLTLRELHAVLQTAMGWEDYHLHLFEVDGVFYGDVEDFMGDLGDEETTTVRDVAARVDRFRYEYDFGDGWDHDLRIGRRPVPAGPDRPRCLGGARACPPEDCGGVPGYQHLLDVLADPAGAEDEDAELLEWLGDDYDPDAFDPAATDELLELHDRHTRQRRRP